MPVKSWLPLRPSWQQVALAVGAATIALPASGKAQGVTIRDSAGVRVVSTGARSTSRIAFELATSPSLELGDNKAAVEEEFTHQSGALRAVHLASGGFAAIDETRVHFFNKRGGRTAIIGRAGMGPGEFSHISSICRTRGDTLVLGDQRTRRNTILSGEGEYVRVIAQDSLGAPSHSSCFDDGTIALIRRMPAASPVAPSYWRITRVRLDGTLVNVVAERPAAPLNPVAPQPLVAVAIGTLLYVGDGSSSELIVYSAAGRVVRVLRTADPRIPITDAEADARMRAAIPPNAPPAVAARLSALGTQNRPKVWPAYSDVHVAPDSTVWIEDYDRRDTPGSPAMWTAIDDAGRVAGRLRLFAGPPGQPEPQVVGFLSDAVMLRWNDADGAAHLGVYRIHRR